MKKTKEAVVLEPPDRKQCQAETRTYEPFGFGPPNRVQRCQNKPVVIATEKKPGPDGAIGSMSLCGPCKEVFEKQVGKNFATYEHLTEPAKC